MDVPNLTDVLSISVRTGAMTALNICAVLWVRSINHKNYHSVQLIFLTLILQVKHVEKGRMKLEICTYQHSCGCFWAMGGH